MTSEIEYYENEIEDLQNRLDIAEYDKERLREEVTNLEAKIKAIRFIIEDKTTASNYKVEQIKGVLNEER